jgi:hypothetical protein
MISQREDIHISAWPSLTPHTGKTDLWSMSAEGKSVHPMPAIRRLTYFLGCHSLSQTYAVESQSFVLHCTAVITEKGVRAMNTSGGVFMSSPGGGSSAIFGPDGRRLTQPTDSSTEGIIYADLDMTRILATKIFADSTGHYSRPDLMSLNVCKKVKKMVQADTETAVTTE